MSISAAVWRLAHGKSDHLPSIAAALTSNRQTVMDVKKNVQSSFAQNTNKPSTDISCFLILTGLTDGKCNQSYFYCR